MNSMCSLQELREELPVFEGELCHMYRSAFRRWEERPA